MLEQYGWPGNVRELRYFIERMVIVTKQKEISAQQLLSYWDDQDFCVPQNNDSISKPALTENERIRQAIEQAEGNISKAARILGIDRSTIYRKMKTLNQK